MRMQQQRPLSKVYFSHRMDSLIDRLLDEMDRNPIDPLKTRTILVSNSKMKQWLLLEIAKRKGIAMGLRVVQIEQLIPKTIGSLELFCHLYTEILKIDDCELSGYLQGSQPRLLDLTEQLTSLFFSYGEFGEHLIEKKPNGWQEKLLHQLFVEGPWRLPIQTEIEFTAPIICFGVDFLPPYCWKLLSRAPNLSIYLFSPCREYWDDLATDQERRSLNRYWKKRGAGKLSRDQLDAYLRSGPKLLANWGKIGRETLKVLDQFDPEIEEVYPTIRPTSALQRIQFDLLAFQQTKDRSSDSSIKIFLAGSSRMREIEALRDEILRLSIPYHEISVLAPNIEPYLPLIEYVFADQIPYRISGFDVATRSSFRQGLLRLLHLASSRWEAEEIMTLFETPAFYKKKEWDQEKLEQFRSWINAAHIKWGVDHSHRDEILTATLGKREYMDQNSWEKGLDRLLDAVVYLRPLQVNPDVLEEFIETLLALKNLNMKGEKTLSSWADLLEKISKEFLVADLNDEADLATESFFNQLVDELRNCQNENLFPAAVIFRQLEKPCFGQIHASHLHAIRFSTIDRASLIPARALFLIGMDEESFPRSKISSSLDLLKGQTPNCADRDRYLFLQALFSAQEFFRISYCHLSAGEGKPVASSLLVQELLSMIDIETTVYRSSTHDVESRNLSWPKIPNLSIVEEEKTINISELRQLARHPWKFYLQKVHGIYLNDELEDSFALEKARLSRAALEQPIEVVFANEEPPLSRFSQALRTEVIERTEEWNEVIKNWQLTPFTLTLSTQFSEIQWDGAHCFAPSIKIGSVFLTGEIKLATTKGLICPNEDTLSGMLKVWPEALIVAMVFNTSQIWMLRNGKVKTLGNVEQSLEAFIEYYFLSLTAPSPLLSDWADPLLRKGLNEFKRKMEKGSTFDDPVMDWVLARAPSASPEEIYTNWSPILKKTFLSLVELYPTKGKIHAAI